MKKLFRIFFKPEGGLTPKERRMLKRYGEKILNDPRVLIAYEEMRLQGLLFGNYETEGIEKILRKVIKEAQ